MWTAPKKKQKTKGSTEGLSEHEINLRAKNVKRIVDSCIKEEDLNVTAESNNHSDFSFLDMVISILFVAGIGWIMINALTVVVEEQDVRIENPSAVQESYTAQPVNDGFVVYNDSDGSILFNGSKEEYEVWKDEFFWS